MKEKLEEIRSKGLKKIEEVKKLEDLQEVTREITGKKSELTEALKSLSELSVEMKKTIGMQATEIKKLFADKLKEKEDELINAKSVVDKPLDLTLPGIDVEGGALHPITQMCYDLNDAFLSLGFEVYSEDDISSEKYAFDNLNFPADHPARTHVDDRHAESAGLYRPGDPKEISYLLAERDGTGQRAGARCGLQAVPHRHLRCLLHHVRPAAGGSPVPLGRGGHLCGSGAGVCYPGDLQCVPRSSQ